MSAALRRLRGLTGAALLVACGADPAAPPDPSTPPGPDAPPLVDGVSPKCVAYKGTEAFGYCIYRYAGGLPDIPTVKTVCAQAGEWEGRCRHAWASGRMSANSGFTTEELLDLCGPSPDCAFQVIDFRPDPSIDRQMALCEQVTGPFAQDCVGHALQSWWMAGVTAEELARVIALPSRFPDRLGFWAGAVVGCSKVGACEGGTPQVVKICADLAEDFTFNPDKCKKVGKGPMHGAAGVPSAAPRGGGRPHGPGQGPPQGAPTGGGVGPPGDGAPPPGSPTPGSPTPAGPAPGGPAPAPR